MSSPFEVFRRHQFLTVILIGLAMLAFVLLGAVPDPRELSPVLLVITFAFIVGGAMWVLGLKEKKQNEWGVTGALAGLAMACAFWYANRPAVAVEIEGGSLTDRELADKQQNLGLANAFLQSVFALSSGGQQRMPQNFLFGFGEARSEAQARKLAIDWELLSREADRLGISVSDEAVNEYLTEMTSGRVRREHVTEARQRYNLAEPQLYQILRNGIAARTALMTLFPRTELPPQQYHDFYNRLNEQRELQVVGLPVEAFVPSVEDPSESELQSLFELYRSNRSNFSDDGRFIAGQPGFFQERQVQLAYAEFPFDAVKATIEPPTEEEIQAEYDARYKRQMEDPFSGAPPLPELNDAEMKPETSAPPAPEKSPQSSDEAKPSDAKADDVKTGDVKTGDAKADEAKAGDAKPSESDAPSEKSESETPDDGEKTSSIDRQDGLLMVAFVQDEPEATEPEASEKPAAESKSSEKADTPAEKASEAAEKTPATDEPVSAEKPAAEMKEAESDTEAAEGDVEKPIELKEDGEPGKKSDEPPSLDEVRDEIAANLIDAKTLNRQNELIRAAQSKMLSLESRLALGDEDTEGLTVAQIGAELKAWVEENGGVYGETPLMSFEKLSESDDFPIGKAFSGREGTVARVAIQAPEGSILNAREAIDFETKSGFAWWTIGSLPAHVAQSLDEPGVREEVIEAWKKQRAYPKAEERAEAIAAKIREAEGDDIGKALSETTITGKDGGDYATLKSTGPITWMSEQKDPRNPLMSGGASMTDLRQKLSLDVPVGGDFMQTAFRELKPGEVGIAPNIDKSKVFVVRVAPAEDGAATPSEEVLNAPFFQPSFMSPYPNMAAQEQQKFQPNALLDLERKYGVEFLQ